MIFPIILALIWSLISNLVGGSKNLLLIYNPGNSNLPQVVEQSFPNAEFVQANSTDEVQAAFGLNGAKIKRYYIVGLVLPQNLESSLRSGNTPAISLYLNGSSINGQTEALLQIAILSYARAIANPQPLINIQTSVINPPATQNAGTILKQVYAPLALLASLMVGITFIPTLLLKEKGKKALRILLVTPASYIDILIGKLLVALVFQLATTCAVLAILGSFTGEVLLIMLYVILGAVFSLSTGLLFGSLFSSVQSANTVSGLSAFIFILGGMFVGQLGSLMGNNIVLFIVKFISTYYLADGISNAAQNLGTLNSNQVDISVILISTAAFLAISIWALRRQTSVLAMI